MTKNTIFGNKYSKDIWVCFRWWAVALAHHIHEIEPWFVKKKTKQNSNEKAEMKTVNSVYNKFTTFYTLLVTESDKITRCAVTKRHMHPVCVWTENPNEKKNVRKKWYEKNQKPQANAINSPCLMYHLKCKSAHSAADVVISKNGCEFSFEFLWSKSLCFFRFSKWIKF